MNTVEREERTAMFKRRKKVKVDASGSLWLVTYRMYDLLWCDKVDAKKYNQMIRNEDISIISVKKLK